MIPILLFYMSVIIIKLIKESWMGSVLINNLTSGGSP